MQRDRIRQITPGSAEASVATNSITKGFSSLCLWNEMPQVAPFVFPLDGSSPSPRLRCSVAFPSFPSVSLYYVLSLSL